MARSVVEENVSVDGDWYNSSSEPGWKWKGDTSSDEVGGEHKRHDIPRKLWKLQSLSRLISSRLWGTCLPTQWCLTWWQMVQGRRRKSPVLWMMLSVCTSPLLFVLYFTVGIGHWCTPPDADKKPNFTEFVHKPSTHSLTDLPLEVTLSLWPLNVPFSTSLGF